MKINKLVELLRLFPSDGHQLSPGDARQATEKLTELTPGELHALEVLLGTCSENAVAKAYVETEIRARETKP